VIVFSYQHSLQQLANTSILTNQCSFINYLTRSIFTYVLWMVSFLISSSFQLSHLMNLVNIYVHYIRVILFLFIVFGYVLILIPWCARVWSHFRGGRVWRDRVESQPVLYCLVILYLDMWLVVSFWQPLWLWWATVLLDQSAPCLSLWLSHWLPFSFTSSW